MLLTARIFGSRESSTSVASTYFIFSFNQQLSLHLDPPCLLSSTQIPARRSTTRSPTPTPLLLHNWLMPAAPLKGSGRRTDVNKRDVKPKRRRRRLAARFVLTCILRNRDMLTTIKHSRGSRTPPPRHGRSRDCVTTVCSAATASPTNQFQFSPVITG